MIDWQPIATAPKDGTPILVYAHNGCVQWELITPLWIVRWQEYYNAKGEKAYQWVEAGGEHYTSCDPVLWAPLDQIMPDPSIIPAPESSDA